MKQSEAEMRAVMDATGLKYDITESGQAVLVMGGLGPNDDRSQVMHIQNFVDTFGPYQDRDVYTAVAPLSEIPKSFDLMLKLLRIVGEQKGGALYATDNSLMYRIDVPVTASAQHLRAAIDLCANIADQLESALTSGKDDL
jgi:hypothetical protein